MQLRVPQRVGTDTDWDAVVSAVDGSCALRSDHSLWCWGTDPGRAQSFAAPTQSGTDTDWGLIRIDVYHACALKLSGALFCRGRGSEGQLGRANLEPSPDFVAIEPAQRYSAVSVGRYHTCARSSAGVVSCTGKNDIGQLGVGDQQLRKVLTEVRPFP
jgi:alpha-tubulin suppressor-like RCC1 family protein